MRRHEKIKHEQNQMNISANSNTSDGDDNGNAPIVQLDLYQYAQFDEKCIKICPQIHIITII
mgnify:CR=1 FL=1